MMHYLNLAQLYQYELHKKDEAMEIYKNLMINYPGSIYVAESTKDVSMCCEAIE